MDDVEEAFNEIAEEVTAELTNCPGCDKQHWFDASAERKMIVCLTTGGIFVEGVSR